MRNRPPSLQLIPRVPTPAANALETRLGHVFRDGALLRLALTHPSIAHEQGTPVPHNQRLEFLGDAVLQLILTRELYLKFPDVGEGPLTKARAKLVNRRSLAEKGRALRLGEELILSRGEEASGGRERPSALADTFEAVLGAIFLDGGLGAAERFVERHFHEAFGELTVIPMIENPKGELQELLQSRSGAAPEYQVASVSGPDHDRLFECIVQYEGAELARGRGKTKKAAESEAAMTALAKLKSAAS
ncbi:MAG TPA: ribonuclease III [Verrucomicrobiae bacterium]|nr:ribonuclease III [Verrucomicrobiae bacterium]